MNELARLLAAKEEADRQLAEAHEGLIAELVAAKDAYRADPTPENRERKDAAVSAVVKYRAVIREGRTTHDVVGDAVAALEG